MGLWIHGHVDTIDRLLRGDHGGYMGLVEALGVGLGAAHLDTIWGLLHHGRGKALEVMSEGGEMGGSCGSSRWVDLWVLTLLHGILLRHVPRWHREGVGIVLSTASKQGHGVISVGHEAHVARGLLLLTGLLLGGKEVCIGVHRHRRHGLDVLSSEHARGTDVHLGGATGKPSLSSRGRVDEASNDRATGTRGSVLCSRVGRRRQRLLANNNSHAPPGHVNLAMVRQLKYHEKKLLKKVDFLNV